MHALRSLSSVLALPFLLASSLVGCSQPGAEAPSAATVDDGRGEGVVEVESGVAGRPHLRYTDGQATQLPHCAIKLANKLNPKIPPCYLNGSPVGFC